MPWLASSRWSQRKSSRVLLYLANSVKVDTNRCILAASPAGSQRNRPHEIFRFEGCGERETVSGNVAVFSCADACCDYVAK